MMQAPRRNVDVLWRVWVLPDAERWTLASGSTMKNCREARRVTLDAERYARLLDGRLPVREALEPEEISLESAA